MQVELEEPQQLDQVCRSQWRLQASTSHPRPVLSLFALLDQNGPLPIEGQAQVPGEPTCEAFYIF